LKRQTPQDLTAPITPPFDRVPQWTTRYKPYLGNLQFSMQTDITRFQADRSLACQAGSLDCQPNGQRALLMSKLSYPVNLGYATITPKLSLLNRSYEFDRALSSGQTQASVSVPTFSLDATTVFERPIEWGQSYTQTLEPRFLYVNTPYRQQNFLPVYDTGSQ
jgi:LPS-assembly protein